MFGARRMRKTKATTKQPPERYVADPRSMTERIDERKIAAGLFELISSCSSPDWFTEQELAVYLRLVNKDWQAGYGWH